MSEAAETAKGRENYITADYGVKSWLLTTDHKRIALMYLIGITFFFPSSSQCTAS
jgi:cytochrome c oxidase subunit 1